MCRTISAASAAQLAKCILLHAYSRIITTASSQLRENKQILYLIADLTSWHSSIFGYKLRID